MRECATSVAYLPSGKKLNNEKTSIKILGGNSETIFARMWEYMILLVLRSIWASRLKWADKKCKLLQG